MSQLLIPALGTVLVLDKDWEFELHQERRNGEFWNMIFPNDPMDYSWKAPPRSKKFCLKKDSKLKMKRIYVRQNQKAYDSVTFALVYDASGEIKKKKPTFWVKLDVANTMLCHVEKEAQDD